ncbi:hypothetical protein N7455_004428, partial [Penicillium solitum]|uniref:uncharacterized protein n=1 Tax=Penicillium solitum TaxID=60172 RepID=UPI0032C46B05
AVLGVGLTPTSFLRRNLYFLPLTGNTNLRLTSYYELLEATVVVFGVIFTGPHILVVMQTNRI